jgi:putative oxidoreductase
VLAFTMVVAIFAAHLKGGLFLSNGGYEYALALLAVSISLLVSGAGRASVDQWLAKRQTAIGLPHRLLRKASSEDNLSVS